MMANPLQQIVDNATSAMASQGSRMGRKAATPKRETGREAAISRRLAKSNQRG